MPPTWLEPDPHGLQALRASISQPPLRARLGLYLNGEPIGSVESGVLESLLPAWHGLQQPAFSLSYSPDESRWHLRGDGTRALQFVAQALHDADAFCVRRQWRDEQLAVCNGAGQPLASAERAIMRLLGLTTRAVHLHAHSSDGRSWMQQRALNKTTDPGLWDTLMGGMVSAHDTLQTALRRETWEEAGLHIEQLQDLHPGGHFLVQRPSALDGGVGYVVERIDWYQCWLPDGLQPQNQDGEVQQFALLDAPDMLRKLKDQVLTTEAALIWLQCRPPG